MSVPARLSRAAVDGARAEEELAGRFLGGGAGRDEPGDLEFLRCGSELPEKRSQWPHEPVQAGEG